MSKKLTVLFIVSFVSFIISVICTIITTIHLHEIRLFSTILDIVYLLLLLHWYSNLENKNDFN